MTRKALAADRLDDSFPHGTPAGYEQGCRGSGGCLNRGTTRMTCSQAYTRYHRDRAYKKAYDAGEIILDRDTPVDTEAEAKRAGVMRRADGGRGFASAEPAPTPAPEPKAKKPRPRAPKKPLTVQPVPDETTLRDQFIDAAVAEYGAALDAQLDQTAVTPEPEEIVLPPSGVAIEWPAVLLATARSRIAELEQQLRAARMTISADRAALDLTIRDRDELAQDVRDLTKDYRAAKADLATARQNLDELAALKHRRDIVTAAAPPTITFDLAGGDLVLELRSTIRADDVDGLRTYLAARTA